MKNMKKLLPLTAVLFSAAALAGTDTSQFELGGVRPSMTGEEAAAAFKTACENRERAVFLDEEKAAEFNGADDIDKRFKDANVPVPQLQACVYKTDGTAEGSITVVQLGLIDGKFLSVMREQQEAGGISPENLNKLLDAEITRVGKPDAQLRAETGKIYYLDDENRDFYGLDTQEESDKNTYLAALCWGDCRIKDNRLITGAKGYWYAIKNPEKATDGADKPASETPISSSLLADETFYIELTKKLRGN